MNNMTSMLSSRGGEGTSTSHTQALANPAKFRILRRRTWSERLRRMGRVIYLRLIRQDDDPNKIAKGLGLGVFLGIFPTFGVGTALALIGASWLKWNRAAAVLGTIVANPLLNPFFLFLSVFLGNLLVPFQSHMTIGDFAEGSFWPGLLRVLPAYLVGNLLVSSLFALLAHALALRAVRKYGRRRATVSDETVSGSPSKRGLAGTAGAYSHRSKEVSHEGKSDQTL
jgi:uncharacterized protein